MDVALDSALEVLYPLIMEWKHRPSVGKSELAAAYLALSARERAALDRDVAKAIHRAHGGPWFVAYRYKGVPGHGLGMTSLTTNEPPWEHQAFRVHASQVLAHWGQPELPLSSGAFAHERELILKPSVDSAKVKPVEEGRLVTNLQVYLARLRGNLAEASQGRDADYRRQAVEFYDKMVRVLRQESYIEQLKRNKAPGGGLVMSSQDVDREFGRFLIVFMPSLGKLGHGVSGGFGFAQMSGLKLPAIQLNVLLGRFDPTYLDTRLKKDTMVHELIHFFDWRRHKARGKYGEKKQSPGGADYYNEPAEFNAYYQEGARGVESMAKAQRNTSAWPRVVKIFFGGGRDFQSFANAVSGRFFDKGWVENMTPDTRRRFLKRLAGLHEYLTDKYGWE